MTTLKDLIRLVKELPEDCFEQAFELINGVKDEAERAMATAPVLCIYCKERAVKNGKKDGIQQYICKSCNKSFSERATSAISNSHASDNVWKAVIRDTVDGVAISKTARELEMANSTVFNMRHKILNAI